MKIDTFQVELFDLRSTKEGIHYYIDGEQVQYVELTFDSLERITLDEPKKMFYRESYDSG